MAMSKAEATAVSESCIRALKNLEGCEVEWSNLPEWGKIYIEHTKIARDEIHRVLSMANAVLGKHQ